MREESRGRRRGEAGENIPSFDSLGFVPAKIRKIVRESPKVKSFYLEYHGASPRPGQFFMAWLPGREEVPMSVSGAEGGVIRISVSNEGETTAGFHGLVGGEKLFLRGPFGNGYSLDGRSFLLVGGGYGAAPLIYAAKSISQGRKKCTYLVGAKGKSELLFADEARRLGAKVQVATEDGSAGHRGLATDLIGPIMMAGRFDTILTCGPERMMYEIASRWAESVKVQASLERYMKCGFGICGSCVLDPIGLRVCSDGPVFDGALLLKTDFGKRKRNSYGARVTI